VNDDELVDLIAFGKRLQAEVRFIEYMDVGGATRWSPSAVVSRAEMLERIARHFGGVVACGDQGSAPAERFLLPDGTTFGVIASTTQPFCGACDRARLTADGIWLMCRRVPRRTCAAHSRGMVASRRPRRRGTSGDGPANDARSAARPEEGRAPGDAHEGGMKDGVRGARCLTARL
jgi:hypothetical protein